MRTKNKTAKACIANVPRVFDENIANDVGLERLFELGGHDLPSLERLLDLFDVLKRKPESRAARAALRDQATQIRRGRAA